MGFLTLDFQLLQARLLEAVRARVRNGEITERSLARLTGISQPHIHNVLKGARFLSIDVADRLLRRLRMDLADLVSAAEVGPEACRMVEILDGSIGPGHPYPRMAGAAQYPFAAAEVHGLRDPVAARLAPQQPCGPPFDGAGVVLLDRSPGPPGEGYFAVDLGGAGAIARMRSGLGLCLWNCRTGAWDAVCAAGDPGDCVRGRVRLFVRQF